MSRRTVLLRKKLGQRHELPPVAMMSVLPKAAGSTGRTQITQHKYAKKPSRLFIYRDLRGWHSVAVYEVEDTKKVAGKKGKPCTVPMKPEKLEVWKRNVVRPTKRS